MKYQLVLQFDENVFDYDEIIKIEDLLIDKIEDEAEVDGHDWGAGEVNFFILTDAPEDIFKKIQGIIDKKLLNILRAAYRELESEDYVIIWPSKSICFNIL